jgi:hypothetical protein
MSKIRITVRNVVTGNLWTEDYDKVGIGDNGNLCQAEDWAHQLIQRFNETCRPGESHRELLKTELLGASTAHDWFKRTDGMSVNFRGRIVDIMECRKCGVTGKRYGLHSTFNVKRDAKFRAKKYEVCDEANRE